MNPPNSILLTYNLYPKGTIEIGYESHDGGMRVGTTSVVARIEIPEDCGNYPDGWFPIRNSISKIKKNIEENKVGDTKSYYLPQEILLNCFSYHWELLWKKTKEKK